MPPIKCSAVASWTGTTGQWLPVASVLLQLQRSSTPSWLRWWRCRVAVSIAAWWWRWWARGRGRCAGSLLLQLLTGGDCCCWCCCCCCFPLPRFVVAVSVCCQSRGERLIASRPSRPDNLRVESELRCVINLSVGDFYGPARHSPLPRSPLHVFSSLCSNSLLFIIK